MKRNLVKKTSFLFVALVLVSLSALVACAPSAVEPAVFHTTEPTAVAPGYEVEILVPGSYFNGVHGLTFDSEDNLYAGSVVGQTTYKIVAQEGEVQVTEYIGPPEGLADDLEFGPDGHLYWTSYIVGKVHRQVGDEIQVLAKGIPGANSLAFNQEGRLFVAEVFLGDALYEIDLKGEEKPRLILEGMGGLNGFDFGPDNKLYGPLWFKGEVVRVDVDTGKMETVAEGLESPAAVNFDSKGNLYAVDTAAGQVVRVGIETGEKTVVADVIPAVDNLALNSKDELFISNMSTNGIYRVDTKTGKVETFVEGNVTCPGGIGIAGETLYVAGIMGLWEIDGNTGAVTNVARMQASDLEYPFVASVKDDTLLLSSWFTGTVQEFDLKTNEATRTLHDFMVPYDVLPLDDGSFLVAELGTGSLLKVSGAEGENREAVAGELGGPVGLAFAGENTVYVTEAMGGNVVRVDLSTGEKEVVASGLKMPEGIAVQADGKILVVEAELQRLVEINPDSGAITPLVEDLAIGLVPVAGTPRTGAMSDVEVSDSGAIYVTGEMENVVYKITHE